LNLAQKTVLRSKNFAFIVVYFVKMKTPCFERGGERGEKRRGTITSITPLSPGGRGAGGEGVMA